jgi:hypothetical protein
MPFDKYFKSSPFALTADREAAGNWAGRPKTLLAIKRILAGLQNRPDSTIDVIWAHFGAGKTHTLYYLMNHLDKKSNIRLRHAAPISSTKVDGMFRSGRE